jgi:hypothetical protein
VIDGTLHIKDLSRWQDLSSAGVVLPLIQGTLGSEYGEAQLARVELSFKSAMPAPRQAPARTSDALDYLNGGSDVKKLESKFALPYALVYDYIGAATAGIAVVPKDVEENYFLMVTDGDLWYQQRAEGASWYLSSYETALHEIGTAKGTVSVMDDPDLVVDLSSPYVRLAIPNLNGNVVCLKEATLNPHEESMEISAGIYSGLNA